MWANEVRKLLAASMVLAAFGAAPTSVLGQENYPAKDVRVIVPFSPGGGTDLVTRIFAQKMSEKFGKAFVVENLAAGSGGSAGSLTLVRSKADGYTIGSGTTSGIQAAAIDPTDFNPLRDLDPVARYGATTLALVVNPKLPVKTVKELVDYVKANPDLTFGSSGVGSSTHIIGEKFAKDAGIKIRHVPYRGEGAAIADLMSGQISMFFVSLAAGKSYIEGGTLRALAVTSEKRSLVFPELPTMIEAGFKDFILDAWYALYVPKGTPANVVDVLVKAVNEIRADPAVKTRLLEQLSFDSSGQDDPKAFRVYMEQELQRYIANAEVAGLRKK